MVLPIKGFVLLRKLFLISTLASLHSCCYVSFEEREVMDLRLRECVNCCIMAYHSLERSFKCIFLFFPEVSLLHMLYLSFVPHLLHMS